MIELNAVGYRSVTRVHAEAIVTSNAADSGRACGPGGSVAATLGRRPASTILSIRARALVRTTGHRRMERMWDGLEDHPELEQGS